MQLFKLILFILYAPLALCAPPYPIMRSKNSTDSTDILDGHNKLKIAREILTTAYRVFEVIEAGIAILHLAHEIREKQQEAEADFTNGIADRLRTNHPDQNVLIYHHMRYQTAVSLQKYVHNHVELDLPWSPGTKGYEVYVFESGVFMHLGDGGYGNWVCDGNFTQTDDGKFVEFYKI